MSADDLDYLKAQRAVVAEQLGRLRPDQKLMRINLESRIEALDEQIQTLEDAQAPSSTRARVVLAFGGKPVAESGAIEAAFGAEALQAFQRLVSVTAAIQEGHTLGARGRIPDEESSRLFITGTVTGSFGFELEEVPLESTQPVGVLRGAVDEASRLLKATRMDDKTYADAISESNFRVVKALADFLGLLESKQATLRLTSGDMECLFETSAEVTAAAERARQTNIHETEESALGVLTGLFAKNRRFEYQLAANSEVISGRIAGDIADPMSLKPYLGLRCVAHIWIVAVERAGQERRTYYLTQLEPLAEEPPR